MIGLCSYYSRYFTCSKRPKLSDVNVKLCPSFTQNEDEEDAIWEQRRYEIVKDVAASLVQRPNSTYDSVSQLDEYNKGGATQHILLWKAMGNIEDALKELED